MYIHHSQGKSYQKCHFLPKIIKRILFYQYFDIGEKLDQNKKNAFLSKPCLNVQKVYLTLTLHRFHFGFFSPPCDMLHYMKQYQSLTSTKFDWNTLQPSLYTSQLLGGEYNQFLDYSFVVPRMSLSQVFSISMSVVCIVLFTCIIYRNSIILLCPVVNTYTHRQPRYFYVLFFQTMKVACIYRNTRDYDSFLYITIAGPDIPP